LTPISASISLKESQRFTLIAAHALSLNITLVTNNEKEFNRVAGLKVENWAK